jgi:hypothetical protein
MTMESTKFHSLLADLHDLLSTYTAKEFREAAARSQDYGEILLGLANAMSKIGDSAINQNVPPKVELEASSVPATIGNSTTLKTVEEFENLLRRSGRAETTSDLQAISRAFQLNVSMSSKDGKARNLTKLAKGIAHSPSRVRTNIIKELSRGSTSETQGWLDVIRGGR